MSAGTPPLGKRERRELIRELERLRHRRDHLALSEATREREDARIDEIIEQLKPK